jgi:hypothetical protein
VTTQSTELVAEVAALLDLMAKHGATRIICGDITVERPLPMPKDVAERAGLSPREQFAQMSPEAQEAELMRVKMRGGMPR